MSRLIKGICLLFLLCVISASVRAADSLNHHQKQKRLLIVGSGGALVLGAGIAVINEAWYKDYPRSRFHWINDNSSWMQIDKCGHVFTAAFQSSVGIEMMKWTGIPRKKAIWIGGLAGILYQTPVEVFDGFSSEWGASQGDFIANTLGSALVISQALAWDEQRIWVKFSYSPTPYADIRPNILGSSWYERILKDYNGQTYWLTVNPSSFGVRTKPWLGISLGYGAGGLLGGDDNIWMNQQGETFDYSHVERYRSFYLSPDIDISRLPVKSKKWKRVLTVLNIFKFPAPALEYRSTGKVRFHWLYF